MSVADEVHTLNFECWCGKTHIKHLFFMFEPAQQGYARRPLCDLNGAEECRQSPLPYHQAGKVRLPAFRSSKCA